MIFNVEIPNKTKCCVFCVFRRKIVERIDENNDNYVTLEELKAWIIRVQKRYIYENVAKVWKDYDLNKDNNISWEEFKKATYGYYLGMSNPFQHCYGLCHWGKHFYS